MVIKFLLHSAFLYRKLHKFETLKINCNAIFLRLKREEKTIVSMCLWHIHVVLFSLSSLVTVKAVMAILGKLHAIEERVNWLQGKLNRSHKYNFLPMGFCVPLDTYETSHHIDTTLSLGRVRRTDDRKWIVAHIKFKSCLSLHTVLKNPTTYGNSYGVESKALTIDFYIFSQ